LTLDAQTTEKTMFAKLTDAIVNMREEEALAAVHALLNNGADAIDILDRCSAAIEEVGKRFENGEYFLPELLMAGEILKNISDAVKPYMKMRAISGKKANVLMGTVKDDIHDIGKNIVTFLLEVNGYEVRDLGIDIPPSRFVEEIRAYRPAVVGLSGLLTVAYDSMKETVREIEKSGLRDDVKIMIGGGQMSAKISTYVGADAFGRDAVHGVALVKEWIRG
jgi:methanogenic corrinoid protein MtbC1